MSNILPLEIIGRIAAFGNNFTLAALIKLKPLMNKIRYDIRYNYWYDYYYRRLKPGTSKQVDSKMRQRMIKLIEHMVPDSNDRKRLMLYLALHLNRTNIEKVSMVWGGSLYSAKFYIYHLMKRCIYAPIINNHCFNTGEPDTYMDFCGDKFIVTYEYRGIATDNEIIKRTLNISDDRIFPTVINFNTNFFYVDPLGNKAKLWRNIDFWVPHFSLLLLETMSDYATKNYEYKANIIE